MTKDELVARLLAREEAAVSESETERRFRATVDELRNLKTALDEHSIVAVTDATGRITAVNDKFCAISQYSREELLGQDHRILNSGYHPAAFFSELWATIGRGQVWHGEIRNRAKDGSCYWVDTTIHPFVDTSGRPTHYVAIRTDITQRKAEAARLQAYARELREMNRELEAIIFAVSHDLRSPLVNVQGFGRQIEAACEKIREVFADHPGFVPESRLRSWVDESIPQALQYIRASTTRMDALLSGLLRYSRVGRLDFILAPIDMESLLAGVVAAAKFQIDEAGAEITIEPLPACLGDHVHTGQVFANLLDNALKYRAPDRALRIQVGGWEEEDRVVYAVTDNGIGIPPAQRSRVFQMFHRLNPDATVGEGLGLTIAAKMVERQRGRIWVESREGEGSTFFVSLPAAAGAAL